MNKLIRHINFSLIIITLALFSLPTVSLAETQKTIYISPFKVHAKKDMSFLKDAMRAMMASRLAANAGLQITENKAKADYTLDGAITAIGNSLSINAKITSADGSTPEATYYATAASEDEIIPAVDTLARTISHKSFSRKETPDTVSQGAWQPQTSPAITPPPEKNAGFETAHPDRAFIQPHATVQTSPLPPVVVTKSPTKPQPQPTDPATVIAQTVSAPGGFQKTRNFPISMQDLTVGDIDGDGTNDLIVASTSEIFVYQIAGTNLAHFGQISLPANHKIISIEIADLDTNGLSEIYVTSVDHNSRPSSMAVHWQNNRFSYLFQNQRWFIKPIFTPGQNLILAGQRGGIEFPMSKGIFELHLQDGQLQEGNKLTVPDQANIYNFAMADLDGDGVTEVIMLDEDDRLHVTMTGGRKLWSSDEHYGGTLRFVGGKSATRKKGGANKQPVSERGDASQDRLYIHSRLIITDINNDNKPDVIVNRNLSSASRIFKNFKAYPSGEIHALTWNGIGLSELWHTPKIDGYVASYTFNKGPNSDQTRLYVGLIINSGWMDMLSAKDSTVLIFPLPADTPDQ